MTSSNNGKKRLQTTNWTISANKKQEGRHTEKTNPIISESRKRPLQQRQKQAQSKIGGDKEKANATIGKNKKKQIRQAINWAMSMNKEEKMTYTRV